MTNLHFADQYRNVDGYPGELDDTPDGVIDDLAKAMQGIRDHAEKYLTPFHDALGREGCNFYAENFCTSLDGLIADVIGECRDELERNRSAGE